MAFEGLRIVANSVHSGDHINITIENNNASDYTIDVGDSLAQLVCKKIISPYSVDIETLKQSNTV